MVINRLFSRSEQNKSNADINSNVQSQLFYCIQKKKVHRTVAFICGKGDDFTSNDAPDLSEKIDVLDKSWEVLRVFYPKFHLDRPRSCPSLFLTENPYGEAAILPAEAEVEELAQYRYLIMTGWNIADGNFSNHMLTYVRNGGTLLLTWAHLYTTSNRSQALSHESSILFNTDVRALTGVRGGDVSLLDRSATGSRVNLIERRIGTGRVLLLNSLCYPGERPACHDYTVLVRRIAHENRSEEYKWGWVSADRGVYAVACDAQDRRSFYLVDVRREKAKVGRVRAVLHMGETECGFPVERAGISVMTLFPGLGVLTTYGTAEVIDFERNTIRIVGSGLAKVVLFRWVDGEIRISERRLELYGEAAEKI